ncbi:BTB/POZ domain-containing protein [Ditylenchus destructor]|uniref:BTB/POZ domain-containing protein n=1 Tax=Ditylenchus destructor TaxID=166010 RepID=A0AAD4NF97_9BILA|nr:BTB/POZ domain-containing protein [Ditylenchus destructor]
MAFGLGTNKGETDCNLMPMQRAWVVMNRRSSQGGAFPAADTTQDNPAQSSPTWLKDTEGENMITEGHPPEESNAVIQLNVGGVSYATTMGTLLAREPDSFFRQLFAVDGLDIHRHVARRFSDGTYFIDRDGELFAYILDYLRNGKLLLPDSFKEMARLREEVLFYQLEGLMQQLMPFYNLKYPPKNPSPHNGCNSAGSGTGVGGNGNAAAASTNPLCETGGFVTLGYRGTFAFGRDGQADVKFRKLHRILVCGKASLCREVFGDTLNESRDPDREGSERYTSRLYLKHQCLERACDNLAEKGFKLVTACSSGANGLTTTAVQAQTGGTQEFMNQRNSGDLEEQRWAHYTEYVFYREPQIFLLGCPPNSCSPIQSPRI